ncbi:hypothetical protein BXZ70DRAFT_1063742 [Cristinia sonorae]|uniref:Uncharacterized protein n=1 Tax=Cristinia sonorae TaxID=1940300 RepID=A0A8K0USI5_9AGAR|nr:hypothetical protein BXZ70DRAFT_1063742 [Cristinia sonorae]
MLAIVSLVLLVSQLVQATIYVTSPREGSSCTGGSRCSIQWLDNGVAPFLSDIGPCRVGLYNGQGRLVEQIDDVDVGATHAIVFVPDPNAGPNSDSYYINFTSLDPVGNPPQIYSQFSVLFTLDGMTGSLASPVPSDTVPPTPSFTSTIAIPTPSTSSSSTSIPTTTSVSSSTTPTTSSTSTSTSSPATTSSSTSSTSIELSSPTSTRSLTAGGTMTIPPSRISTISRASQTSTSTDTLNPTSASAGVLDGKPSKNALTIVSALSAVILFGSSIMF